MNGLSTPFLKLPRLSIDPRNILLRILSWILETGKEIGPGPAESSSGTNLLASISSPRLRENHATSMTRHGDAVGRLDAQIIDLGAHAAAGSPDAEFLAAADDACFAPDSESPASLSQLRRLVDSVASQEHLASPLYAPFRAKAAVTARQLLSRTLIRAALPTSSDLLYWNQLDADRLWRFVYFAQTMPNRLASYASSLMRQSTGISWMAIKTSGDLLLDSCFPASTLSQKPKSGNGSPATVQRSQGRPGWRLSGNLLRTEVRLKKTKVDLVRDLLASCIGYLAQPDSLDGAEALGNRALMQCNRVLDILDAALGKPLNIMVSDDLFKSLATSLENESSTESTEDLATTLSRMSKLRLRIRTSLEPVSRPSLITRYWLPTTLSLFSLASAHRRAIANWSDLVNLAGSVRDTIFDFFDTWIIQPLLGVWATIRQPDSSLGVMNNADSSISSDLDSLERMVVDFARDRGTPAPLLPEVGELARMGDLGLVQRAYESEMRSPIRNALGGDLVRTLLIQIRESPAPTTRSSIHS